MIKANKYLCSFTAVMNQVIIEKAKANRKMIENFAELGSVNQIDPQTSTHRDRTRASTLCFFYFIFFLI